ncbi:hypothetical protein ANCCEY_02249 [Ancylostoma ceylanicum]|uniref:Uncharacterized protein n=1 Tax=Ancylostoma ceylanicum TaxID=53326 RepID=A0A0D6M837_9BILA|nr:hypothetical protein ANCCEY_02249 [Ancylostoma ceylanicum]
MKASILCLIAAVSVADAFLFNLLGGGGGCGCVPPPPPPPPPCVCPPPPACPPPPVCPAPPPPYQYAVAPNKYVGK